MKDKQRRWQQSVQWKMQKIMKLISALYSLPLAVATILNSLAPAAADFSVVFLRLFPWRLAAVENFLYAEQKKKKDDNISGSGKWKTRSNTTMRLVLFSKVYKRGKQNF